MAEAKTYESFPVWIAILANVVALSIYAIGAYILAGFTIFLVIPYLLYCLWVEIGVLRGSCVHCYYYGKVCGLGKGKLCSLLFKKGNPQRFAEREISWYHMLPDFIVSIIPLVGGFVLLVSDFSWLLLALLAILAMLSTGGNAV